MGHPRLFVGLRWSHNLTTRCGAGLRAGTDSFCNLEYASQRFFRLLFNCFDLRQLTRGHFGKRLLPLGHELRAKLILTVLISFGDLSPDLNIDSANTIRLAFSCIQIATRHLSQNLQFLT